MTVSELNWVAELHAIREDAAKIAGDSSDARMTAAYMAGAVKVLIERLLAERLSAIAAGSC
jgi:hypothetical protein